MSRCQCQDSYGNACGREMTAEEEAQDGMCDACACNLWEYLVSKGVHVWSNTSAGR